MKNIHLILVALLAFGCDESKQKDIDESFNFEIRNMDDVSFHDSTRYNGTIDFLNDNSWVFTSHNNDECINKTNHHCKKVDANYVEGVKVEGRVVKTSFDLNILEFNLLDSPYYVILYQDWVRILPDDTNGNHPITTLKLKVFDGKLNLCHYRNDWQWGYDFGDNRNGTSIDVDHSLHQENNREGCYELLVGYNYKIDILNFDDGKFQFHVNDKIVSSLEYRTKSDTEPHVIQWGMYWSGEYNRDNNQDKRIVIQMKNFNVYEGY